MASRLSDGRLHLQHGPIDLVILGTEDEYERAAGRFGTLLEELVQELALLRTPVGEAYPLARGAVARRMIAAVWPHRAVFITPMAAVAGAVADEILEAMQPSGKAYVNNGGDSAVHLPRGETFAAGIVDNPQRPMVDATVRLKNLRHRHLRWREARSRWYRLTGHGRADCGARQSRGDMWPMRHADHPAIKRYGRQLRRQRHWRPSSHRGRSIPHGARGLDAGVKVAERCARGGFAGLSRCRTRLWQSP